jgi:hypothetical protein
MKAGRTIRRLALIMSASLVPVVIGCSDGAVEPPAGLVGTWNATSLVVDGVNLMDEGMTLSFTFSNDSEYSYSVTNDALDFCDLVANCSDSGDFSATGSQITFDPGTVDAETFSWSIVGSTLTVTATIEGSLFTFTFERQ